MDTLAEITGLTLLAAMLFRAALSAFWMAERQFVAVRAEHKEFKTLSARVSRKLSSERERQRNTWSGSRPFRIIERRYENASGSICSFYLAPCDNKPIPSFRPGQFLTFELPGSPHQQPIVRCYSLSNSPTEKRFYRITVKRISAPHQVSAPDGVVSTFLHDHCAPGSMLNVSAPAGSFCVNQSSTRPVVLIGGGVGLTPLMSMIDWLIASKSNREIIFFYGVRNRNEHAMYDYLKRLERTNPNFHTVIFYSQPTAECRRGVDYDLDGHVTVDVISKLLQGSDYEFYICGPTPMIETVSLDLQVWGVPNDDIKFESFSPASLGNSGAAPDQFTGKDITPLHVKFARSKRTVRWTPGTKSLLELAEANGLKPRFGCRAGNCGSCAVSLKDGDIGYSREPNVALEPGRCLICISRPTSDVTLDL